jgi:hypothetical protein
MQAWTTVVQRCSSSVNEDEGVDMARTASGSVEEDMGIGCRTVVRGTGWQRWWRHGGVEQRGVEDRGVGHGVGQLPH